MILEFRGAAWKDTQSPVDVWISNHSALVMERSFGMGSAAKASVLLRKGNTDYIVTPVRSQRIFDDIGTRRSRYQARPPRIVLDAYMEKEKTE